MDRRLFLCGKHWEGPKCRLLGFTTETNTEGEEDEDKHGCRRRGKHGKRKKGKKTGGKVGGMEGRGHRYALVPLNGSLHSSHRPWLVPYTSCLHVKGRLLCAVLTAHLTCLQWKKGGISLPVAPLAPPLDLTNQLAGHFSRKVHFFTLMLSSERAASPLVRV